MRKVVAIEGISTIDGRFIIPGALFPDDRAFIPVTAFNADRLSSDILGRATVFRRDRRPMGGWEISFEFTMHTPQAGVRAKTESAQIFCTNLKTDAGRNGELLVHKAMIREIQLVGNYWAWRER